MEGFDIVITELEKSLREKLDSHFFYSKQDAQEEFDAIWTCAIDRIRSIIPADKYFVVETIQNPPSIIKFVYLSGRWEKWLYKLKKKLFKTRDVSSNDIIGVRQIAMMSRQILRTASIASAEALNTKDENTSCAETVSLKKFNRILEIVQRSISDMYVSTDVENAQKTKKNMMQSLYGQGYEIIEYDGTNDALFDVRADSDCQENVLISPTIRNWATGKVELMGIVYKPCKK